MPNANVIRMENAIKFSNIHDMLMDGPKGKERKKENGDQVLRPLAENHHVRSLVRSGTCT